MSKKTLPKRWVLRATTGFLFGSYSNGDVLLSQHPMRFSTLASAISFAKEVETFTGNQYKPGRI